jgi:hypothetical protein
MSTGYSLNTEVESRFSTWAFDDLAENHEHLRQSISLEHGA